MANGCNGSGDAISLSEENDSIIESQYQQYQGKSFPELLRPEAWQTFLKIKVDDKPWNEIFDLPEQTVIRRDCQSLVDRLGNEEEDKLAVVSDLESVITKFCKVSNLHYTSDSPWLDILAPLLSLELETSQLYHCFHAILTLYIPRRIKENKNPYHLLRLVLLYHDPELCSFLDTKKITPDMFASLWFQSLFASLCNLQVIHIIWDIYFHVANPFLIFYLSLVIVVNSKEALLGMKEESKETILEFLKAAPSALEAQDIEDFCSLANYYEERTPQTFLKEYQKSIFDGSSKDQCLSHALCLPVAITELIEQNENHPKEGPVKFFVVDCRPAEQYNNGHLSTAFHLDASLMLQEPAAFDLAVQALWAAQKQALAANSPAGGEHVCFLGSGRDEEDQYVHMVISNFLHKQMQHVSLALGGYAKLHSYPHTHLTDHNKQCFVCSEEEADSGSFLGKFASAVRVRTSGMRERLSGIITNPATERHVSSNDRLEGRYREKDVTRHRSDDLDDDQLSKEEVSIKTWIKKDGVLAYYQCEEIKQNGDVYPSYLIVTRTHLYVLREIPQKRGLAHIISRRSLLNLIKITSKKNHSELITFKYGISDSEGNYQITSVEKLYIPEASKATKVIKNQLASLIDAP